MNVIAVADETRNASQVTSKGHPRPVCKHKSSDACLRPQMRRRLVQETQEFLLGTQQKKYWMLDQVNQENFSRSSFLTRRGKSKRKVSGVCLEQWPATSCRYQSHGSWMSKAYRERLLHANRHFHQQAACMCIDDLGKWFVCCQASSAEGSSASRREVDSCGITA